MSAPSLLRAETEIALPPGEAAGVPIPWWAKLGIKIGLGTLRVPPALLRRFGLQRHTFLEGDAGKLVELAAAHIAAFEAATGRRPRSLLEIGPARMVARAPVFAALGIERILYLDVEDDAPNDLARYVEAADLARAAGLVPPRLEDAGSRAEVLARCNATLLIGGPEALAGTAAGSVDLVLSESVLEHVRRDAVTPLLAALRRVTAADGLQIHNIDLKDHMGGGRRHLGFASGFWEGAAIARSGIYTNRLGASAWMAAFRAAGLAPRLVEATVWPGAPPAPEPHPDTGHGPQDARFASALIHAAAAP